MSSSALAAGLADIVGENAEHLGIEQWLDTALPELNWVLGNDYNRGLPVGRLVEVFGPASSGKTFLATMAMIAAQQAGGIAGFSDHERTFEPELAESLGLKMTLNDGFIYKRPETFEESVNICMTTAKMVRERGLIDDDKPMIWVFDSVASMIPHEKLYDSNGKSRLGKDAKANMRDKLALATCTSQHYPILAQFAEDNNMLILLLNQIRTDPGVMYGDPNKTPGGKASEFYTSIRLSIGRKEIKNDKKEIIGSHFTAKTTKNKCARFGRSAEWDIYFREDKGAMVDAVGSNVDFVLRRELIPRSGTYYEWEGKKYQRKSLTDLMRKDTDQYRRLMSLITDSD